MIYKIVLHQYESRMLRSMKIKSSSIIVGEVRDKDAVRFIHAMHNSMNVTPELLTPMCLKEIQKFL